MLRFIDLFSGIGGFHVALKEEGMECVFACDIDKKARESYYANFGLKPKADITEVDVEDIPSHDVLCAGFPCQSFSVSGNLESLNDKRGQLFFEIVRIAKHHNPQVLLLENVKNILQIDDGQVIKTIEEELDKAGYIMKYCLLNSSFFGVPQKRERVYFVCLKKDSPYTFSPPTYSVNEEIYLQDIMDTNPDSKLYLKESYAINWTRKTTDCAMKPIRLGYINKGAQGDRVYSHKGHATTLLATSGGLGARTGLYTDNTGRVRKLSKVECKRIMGFNNSHVVSDGIAGIMQLGNAVIPSIVRKVYNHISNTN